MFLNSDGFYEDDNHNVWDSSKFSMERAYELSGTLHNCRYCTNCSKCSGCYECVDCHNCTKCHYCTRCQHCEYMSYSTDCTNRQDGYKRKGELQ